MSGFNVAKDPWIKCVSRSGAVVEVSMEDALLNAEDIVSIVDPCPLVEVSITRLLLAALHRIIEGPKDEDHWARVAKDGLGDKNIKDYFKGVSASLELFDDVRPFYQALVDPTTDVKSPAAIAQEMASGNNATLFDHTSDGMRVEFTPAEAARRLVTMQSYDLGGTHTGEKADPQNRRAQHAPLSGSVAILVRGDSLQRTLLMNLVRYDPSHEAPFKVEGQDLPAWEQDREPGNEEWRPRGYLDLLTYQSRRIRLYREGDGKVTGAIVAKGRNIPESFDIMGAETMIPFLKASEERGFLPMRFRSERSLWRDSLAMISASSWNTPWGDRKGIPPANINWANDLKRTRVNLDYPFIFSATGLISNQSNILSWKQEFFPLRLVHLDDTTYLNALGMAIGGAEAIGRVVELAEEELAREVFKLEKGAESRTRAHSNSFRYWAALETPFKRLMAELAEEDEEARENVLAEWGKLAVAEARRAFYATNNKVNLTTRSYATCVKVSSKFEYRLRKAVDESLSGGS